MGDVTELIAAARGGDRASNDRLFEAVYADLHRIAERHVDRRRGDGMQATSLVHEAWFRLARPEALAQGDREHFFAVAARAMRQLVVDHARHRAAAKRGGGADAEPIDEQYPDPQAGQRDADVLALDQALERLAAVDDGLAQLVELRFFGGLEEEEIADVLETSVRTTRRDWAFASAWLARELAPAAG